MWGVAWQNTIVCWFSLFRTDAAIKARKGIKLLNPMLCKQQREIVRNDVTHTHTHLTGFLSVEAPAKQKAQLRVKTVKVLSVGLILSLLRTKRAF
ncbi:hypothetical protein E2C01_019719 [Portunus trituberculatus]|uniref:Uncharacterized protein n=1 Tax=Portunus trituberculatus TaxID=210409 RepID=A0A5B7E053_PORTR|nr:hypothetical protein [Portunus trituberculatus]